MTGFGIPALFGAGLLTFFSPCVLPLVPVYLAMLAGTSVATLRQDGRGQRLLLATTAFSVGIAVVFVSLGLAASAVGRTLSGHRALVAQLAGLAVFLAGLKLMGFLRVPWLDREARPWLASIKEGKRAAVAVAVRRGVRAGLEPVRGSDPRVGAALRGRRGQPDQSRPPTWASTPWD